MAHAYGSAVASRPPMAEATAPLRSLAPVTEARMAARMAAGLPAVGDDYPRRRVWPRAVAPSALLAAVDLAGVGVGFAHGQVLLAVVAIVLFVALAGIAVLGARFAAGDPLRLTGPERRAIAEASRWQSRQDWTGPLAGGTERGVVIAAATAAERIARSPAWRSGRIDELRVHLDLAHELDQIDDQAHRIAAARTQYGPAASGSASSGSASSGSAPVLDQAWAATVDRVAALTAYANQLDGYEQRRIEAMTRQGDPLRDSDLLTGSAGDQMASEEMLALMVYLNANFHGGGP